MKTPPLFLFLSLSAYSQSPTVAPPMTFNFYYYLDYNHYLEPGLPKVLLTQTVAFPGTSNLGFSIGTLPPWLSVTPASSNVPVANLTLTVDPVNLTENTYSAQIAVLQPSGSNAQSATIPVTLTVDDGTPKIATAVNAASAKTPIAPNTWVTLYGTDLSPYERTWRGSDFVNGQMPTSLDGVSVKFGSQNAFISYISPTQVNVLTPPTLDQGSVSPALTIVYPEGAGSSASLTSCGNLTCPPSLQSAAVSPAFFTFGTSPYVAAEHGDGSYLGPTSLIPGLTTPAKPGETISLFANGFGATSQPFVTGSLTQSGTLPSNPVVTIGGLSASVEFAGLISPGLFQLNVVVPPSAANGDNAIVATYGGVSTQNGLLLTVQR